MGDAPSSAREHPTPLRCMWACKWARKMEPMDEFEPFTPRIECRSMKSASFAYLLDARSIADGCKGFEPAEASVDGSSQQGTPND